MSSVHVLGLLGQILLTCQKVCASWPRAVDERALWTRLNIDTTKTGSSLLRQGVMASQRREEKGGRQGSKVEAGCKTLKSRHCPQLAENAPVIQHQSCPVHIVVIRSVL